MFSGAEQRVEGVLLPARASVGAGEGGGGRANRREHENKNHCDEEHIAGLPGLDSASEHNAECRSGIGWAIPLLPFGHGFKVIPEKVT